MSTLQINYKKTCLLDLQALESLMVQLIPEINSIEQCTKNGYNTAYAAFALPDDAALRARIKAVAVLLLQSQPELIILVGIGGSSLGTLALVQALYGSYANTQFYCADTLDIYMLKALLALAEQALCDNKSVMLLIVTKSGTTTETIANSSFFIELLKKYRPLTYSNAVVVLTDKLSPLYTLAQQNKYVLIDIPPLVGGRYSVLSAVGLLPLALLGADIDSLHEGARVMRDLCFNTHDIWINNALASAAIIYRQYTQKRTIHDTFVFSPDLVGLGNWYRQLVGESLAKHTIGITPTVSVGTADLHSVVQLYLAGPHDKITTFVWPTQQSHTTGELSVPDTQLAQLVPGLVHKTVTDIKHAIFRAVQAAYIQEQRPFMTIEFDIKSSYALGQYIMLKQCEVLYLGYFLGVPVFDQPAVELYKSKTREILCAL